MHHLHQRIGNALHAQAGAPGQPVAGGQGQHQPTQANGPHALRQLLVGLALLRIALQGAVRQALLNAGGEEGKVVVVALCLRPKTAGHARIDRQDIGAHDDKAAVVFKLAQQTGRAAVVGLLHQCGLGQLGHLRPRVCRSLAMPLWMR